jgi:hypothetical protein
VVPSFKERPHLVNTAHGNIMSFRSLSIATTCFTGALGAALLAAPEFMWNDILRSPPPNTQVFFAGRRLSCLFFGLAGIAWNMRHLPPSSVRTQYCRSVATAFAALATLGVWELYGNKMAKASILKAVASEVFFAGAYLYYSMIETKPSLVDKQK